MPASTFAVDGPTCGVCLAELLDHVREVEGVDSAAADLSRRGPTRVVLRGRVRVSEELVHAAIGRAGFRVVSTRRDPDDRGGRRHATWRLAASALAPPQDNEIRRGGSR